jgi:hypothetical protein
MASHHQPTGPSLAAGERDCWRGIPDFSLQRDKQTGITPNGKLRRGEKLVVLQFENYIGVALTA